jgi:hypothetical protein
MVKRDRLILSYQQDLEIVVRACFFARSILEVLFDFLGPEKLSKFAAEDFAGPLHRALQWPRMDFDKNAKYFCIRPLAEHLHNPLPCPPPVSYGPMDGAKWLLFTGAAKRFLKARLNSFNGRNTRLMVSLFQGVKRGCYTVAADLVESSYRKHSATLSATKEPSWFDSELYEGPSGLVSYVRRIVHSLYRRPFKDYNLYEPSTSAAYSVPRSQGGSYEAVLQYLGMRELGGHLHLHSMVETAPGEVTERYCRDAPSFQEVLAELSSRYRLEPLRCIVPFNFYLPEGEMSESFMSDLFWPLEEDRPLLPSRVEVSAVLEPLKVRLVSKGEPLKYWMARAFQKYMWRGLQLAPAFRLTGRPLLQSDLEDLRRYPGGSWVSGDYSGATDSIRMYWTILTFEAIIQQSGCDPYYARLLRRAIYGQQLQYPTGDCKGGLTEPVWQRSGQLMGSPLSFPLLCILNLAAYWRSLETAYGVRVPFRKLPVLVNGDDILFQIQGTPDSDPLYRAWIENITAIGFELSPGKNYVHRHFLTVNSEAYLDRADSLTHLPYMNVGLLMGRGKISTRGKGQSAGGGPVPVPLQERYRKSVLSAMDVRRAHRRFIHYNRREIDAMTFNGLFSLHVHPLFGGLGFPSTPGSDLVRLTPFQKQLGSFLRDRVARGFRGTSEDIPSQYCGISIPPMSAFVSPWSGPRPKRGHFAFRRRLDVLPEGSHPFSECQVPTPLFQREYESLSETTHGPSSPAIGYKLRFPARSLLREMARVRSVRGLRKASVQVLCADTSDYWWVQSP